MMLKLAQLVGVPTWAIKIAVAVLLLSALGVAKCSYDASVIKEHEAEVQANVKVVTGEAETEADAELKAAVAKSIQEMETDRRKIENAKAENRSPLDALFD
jgi:hypothetical protein